MNRFITVLHSISVVMLDNDGGGQDRFIGAWNNTVREYNEKYNENNNIQISRHEIRVREGNVITFTFVDGIELPEDSLAFMNILKKRLSDANMKVTIIDKSSRTRVYLE